MPRRELTDRLNEARRKERGCSLTSDDVVEIVDSVLSMALVITQLNTKALAISIPPEALADTMVDCLCVGHKPDHCCIGCSDHGWYIYRKGDKSRHEGETFLDVIDLWRRRHGKTPMTGVQITIPGTALYDQLVAASALPGN